ncbi:hypothetical protein ACVWWO_000381 [Bradyrhizobium sp. F1.13.1]
MLSKTFATAALGLAGALAASQAHAQSASSDQEIALLKQQLRVLEQKLDKLQKQTAANTVAAASAKAEARLEARSEAKVAVANASAAIPVKGPAAAAGVVVTMPNNRPTICTADEANCIAITGRVHWDVGGYDYRPNTAATVPQRDSIAAKISGAHALALPASSSTTGISPWSTTSAAPPTDSAAPRQDPCQAAAYPAWKTPSSATPG